MGKLKKKKQKYICSYHWTVGFGSPTRRHSIVIFLLSSVCVIMGLSVNVGFIPSSGTGASSPKVKTYWKPTIHHSVHVIIITIRHVLPIYLHKKIL